MVDGWVGKMSKIIEAKELRAQNRQKLEDIIPIATPFAVYIEPTNLCNFQCVFCPTGDRELLKIVNRPSGSIDYELFRKIIEDLKQFDSKIKLANVYKDGEPLVYKRFPDMIKDLKEADVVERIWTKTNGALLNPELNTKIIEAGLDLMCISVESVNVEGYLKIANVKIDYEKFKDNIADFFSRRAQCKLYIKIADTNLSEEEIAKFYRDFEDISDYIGIEKLMGWSYSDIKDFTLGTNPDTYDGLPLIPKDVCAYPFYIMAINFNGTVSLCGNDCSHHTVVGDCNNESLKEIWEGKALYEFQKMHLECRRHENKACGNCYYLQVVPDNIDPFRFQILEKLKVKFESPSTRDSALPDSLPHPIKNTG